MRNKKMLLPRLAAINLRKNIPIYLPYILTCAFSVFIYFVFNSISYNEIMKTAPHAFYLFVFMQTGTVLLSIVLFPFLFYTNNFLMKRRKRELGLYNILGLGKNHIAFIVTYETLIIFTVALVLGIFMGVVFSRMIFLLLLNLTGLPVDTEFNLKWECCKNTITTFVLIFSFNLFYNILQVYLSKPIELLSSSSKGEKDLKPFKLIIMTLVGILFMWRGYSIALKIEINSEIFVDSFIAVFWVIIGTYCIFTSGSIVLLKILKAIKGFYYKSSNFVTIADMLYRMKKNAASLVNICIFSTMVIITVVTTISLYLGTEDILKDDFCYDVEISLNDSADEKEAYSAIQKTAQKTGVTIEEMIGFKTYSIRGYYKPDSFQSQLPENEKQTKVSVYEEDWEREKIELMTIETYNQMEGKNEVLPENEILFYSTEQITGVKEFYINNDVYSLREIENMSIEKRVKNAIMRVIYVVVPNQELIEKYKEEFNCPDKGTYNIRFNISGSQENEKEFVKMLWENLQGEDFIYMNNILDKADEIVSQNGGLVFIGIFFGIIFTICLVLIMYYKQVTEGYEDREKFIIMKKVGMSDDEIKSTVGKQVLLVFFIPFIGAVIHMAAAFRMVSKCLGVLGMYNIGLILKCTIAVSVIFAVLYIISYIMTSKSYYKIISKE